MRIHEAYHPATLKFFDLKEFDSLKALAQESCPETLQAMANTKRYIYKGGYHFHGVTQDFAVWMGDESGRISRNTENYYTLFMDNLEEWKTYPKRNEGLICTTYTHKAEGYGQLELVIPFDSTDIGVCPESDIWDSFPQLEKDYSLRNMSEFGEMFRSMRITLKKLAPSIKLTTFPFPGETWASLTKFLQFADKVLENTDMDFEKVNEIDQYGLLSQSLSTGASVESLIAEAMDPDTNGFELGTYAKLADTALGKNNEVWFSGKAVIVNNRAMNAFATTRDFMKYLTT